MGQTLGQVVDTVLDRSVVLGYSRIGSGLRAHWWPADAPPDALAGRRVLVTGATSGIGAAAVDGYLSLGATVHLLGRNAEKVAAAVAARHLGDRLVGEVCDVGDLDAVRRWAADFTGRVPELHAVLHNAGTMTGDRRETSAQGHELSLAVHVLGPHLLTGLLLPALRHAGDASVVWMSSGGMYGARLHADDEDDIEYRTGDYDGVRAYARTKRMQVVLAAAWAESLADSGVAVTSMHPGWSGTPGVVEHLPRFEKVARPLLRTAADAADTAIWLVATRPRSVAPHFWHDRAQRPVTFPGQRPPSPDAVQRLVDHVVEATGQPLVSGP
ncbi:SDR family NAD(P)-dependent oxidoreductase [Nocardioides caeni]|uniref:SDR family NAD(P)-dependent oxidoreductase n=1 Tax=Nocardioides caeni TaxID=574700 RepID=A0A4V4HJK6_9ACTN|nr:SDR family NAD(P)-dependent oxidoreductase [Nocardioides caeni]THV10836.1 SDR family NAD(P)-dependent oxidoreductase [Nocardioides caeni]